MPVTTVTSKKFNQDVRKIKPATQDYQKITESKESIVGLLAIPDAIDIDFEPAKLNKEIYQSEDFD